MSDAVRKLKVPIVEGAAAEFPAVLADLRSQFGLPEGPVGLLGGSDGAAVLGQVVLGARASGLEVAAAVVVSPVSRMRAIVDAVADQFGFAYPWDAETLAIAERHDLVARAEEFAAAVPAFRIIVGAGDDEAVTGPARELEQALRRAYGERGAVDLQVIDGMAHALAEEPGIDPAPQTPHAGRVNALASEWLARHLSAPPG